MIQHYRKYDTIQFLLKNLLAVVFFAGCAGQSPAVFSKEERPGITFFQLDVTDRVHRATDPRDAVTAYLKIRNHSPFPIELYRVRAVLEGTLEARVEAERESIIQSIPANDSRIVRVKMLLTDIQSPLTSTGPMITTLRGSLSFRTEKGKAAITFREQLDDFMMDED